MSKGICKTCGGEAPNHFPSMFDPKGIGHPNHCVQAADTSLGESVTSEPLVKAEASPRDTQIELDTLVGDIIALGTDHSNDPPAPQNDAEAKAQLSALISKRVLEGRLVELDLLEQAINSNRDINKFKLDRLAILTKSLEEK